MALTSHQTHELNTLITRRRDALIADLDQAELSRDVDELRGLEAARERIASGDYGVCVDCERDIGFERLRATPSAIRCIACQTLHEKTFAGPGNPSL
jgi:RNA polymerase-binding transcription factor DksA